jgi:hypothetical protein
MAKVMIVNSGSVDLEREHEDALRYCSRVEALTKPREEELILNDYYCEQEICNLHDHYLKCWE